MSESYEWVIWHVWVMSHMWMSHVTHVIESCHTNEWVMLRIWRSMMTYTNESYDTYESCEWVMWVIWWFISFWMMRPSRDMWHRTHSYAQHALWHRLISLNESCMSHLTDEWHRHIWVSRAAHMSLTLYVSYGTYESCHTCEWVVSCVWMTWIWMVRDVYMNKHCDAYECGMWDRGVSHVRHMGESCNTHE